MNMVMSVCMSNSGIGPVQHVVSRVPRTSDLRERVPRGRKKGSIWEVVG